MHLDAVQFAGKLPWKDSIQQVNSMAFSGHKLGALQGIGVLWVKSDDEGLPLIVGGSQEKKRRGGTENLLGALTLGAAVEAHKYPDVKKEYMLTQEV